MAIFNFKVIGVSKANIDKTFVVGVYRDLDQAEAVVANETKAYTNKGSCNWEFVVQNVY